MRSSQPLQPCPTQSFTGEVVLDARLTVLNERENREPHEVVWDLFEVDQETSEDDERHKDLRRVASRSKGDCRVGVAWNLLHQRWMDFFTDLSPGERESEALRTHRA